MSERSNGSHGLEAPNTERGRLIDEILAVRAGIYGAEVCQICADLDTFWGLNAARGIHTPGGDLPEAFVCRECWRAGSGRRALTAQIRGQSHCYCELCRQRGDRDQLHPVGCSWLCGACRVRFAHESPELDEAKTLGRLKRRRYLELQLETVEACRTFLEMVIAMRRKVDRILRGEA